MDKNGPPKEEVPGIPRAAIERWGGIKSTDQINLFLTKEDLDNLFIGLRTILQAQESIAVCLHHFSYGKAQEANSAFEEFRRLSIQGGTRVNALITSVMQKAEPGQRDDK